MKYFFCVSVFFILFSCAPNDASSEELMPEGLIDTNTFVAIIADMHIVDAGSKFQMFPDNRKNSNKYSQYIGVLKNYDIPKSQWDSTMNYYSARPVKFDHLYTKVLEILSEKQAKLKAVPDSSAKK
ncbi:MAG: DUF4296 domain-containing protein [Bacteroidetes bacterium]|nr:DUF4296 domain-containing protein [Bacteroidota bacterium]